MEYDEQVRSYLDANDLKPSDLVKPKVRKKETKKPQSGGEIQQQAGETQQRYQLQQQAWPISAVNTAQPSTRPTGDTADDG